MTVNREAVTPSASVLDREINLRGILKMTTRHSDVRVSFRVTKRPARFLLAGSALILILGGLAALLLGMTGRFLPHDENFLGMTAAQLCAMHGCRIVHFMVHD